MGGGRSAELEYGRVGGRVLERGVLGVICTRVKKGAKERHPKFPGILHVLAYLT